MLITLLVGMSLLNAASNQDIAKLQAEKKVLELKLEAYALKKKIIEMEKFIEEAKLEKKAKIEREKALIQLKNDLRANRESTRVVLKRYAG
jgi:proteasome assembly chaperone (PAC2) family protein